MRPNEIRSEVVSDIRRMRSEGRKVSRIVADLKDLGLTLTEITDYFRIAFLPSFPINLRMMPMDESGHLNPDILDEFIGKIVDDASPRWKAADPYPDLMRRRDRHAFREVARETKAVIIVEASNPLSGRYIGKPGFRVSPLHFFGLSRKTPPGEGLMALDPDDGKLKSLLESFRIPYDRLAGLLGRHGFAVGMESEGFVLRDGDGKALIPGYRLVGVYGAENGKDLYRGEEGERIRADLNRIMGQDLVRHGTLDSWDLRLGLPEDSPFRYPQVPVLFFLPNGDVIERHDLKSMASYCRYLGIKGDAIPSVPASESAEKGVD